MEVLLVSQGADDQKINKNVTTNGDGQRQVHNWITNHVSFVLVHHCIKLHYQDCMFLQNYN